MERLFDLDLQLLTDSVYTVVNVCILCIVASYLFFNPVRDFLRSRQERIKSDIDTAQQDKEDALALKQEYQRKLDKVDKEAEEILSSARKKATKNEAKLLHVKEHQALLLQKDVVYDQNQEPVHYTKMLINSERYQTTVSV